MEQSLVDIFCPPGERIRKIVGKRVTGITDTDAAALGMFDTRIGSGDQSWIYANVSWKELRAIAEGHVFSSGGAPNMFSMMAQYPTIVQRMRQQPEQVYAFTLEDMMQAIQEQPQEPPMRWIYHTPVLETLQKAGVDVTNYLKMRFLPDVSNIGQTEDYKQRGVPVPHWVVEATAVVPSERQKPLSLMSQDVPFVEGWDPFLILAGVNFVNPQYNMMVFVGGRAPSTFAAELLAIGKGQITKQELEDAAKQAEMRGAKLLTSIQLPEKPHDVKGISSFTEETLQEFRANLSNRYGGDFKGEYLNVAIVGIAHMRSGLPERVSGPIDIRFYNPA